MSRKQKPFSADEAFTTIGNSFLDNILPMVSPVAGVLLMLVYRQTKGWQRTKVALSYDAISLGLSRVRSTRISRQAISKGIKELKELGILIVEQGQTRFDPNVYSINFDYETDWVPVDLDCSNGKVVSFPAPDESGSESELRSSKTELERSSEMELDASSETELLIGRKKINLLKKGGRKDAPPSLTTPPPENGHAITTALEDAYPGHATNFRTIAQLFDLAVRVKASPADVAGFHGWLKANYPMKADTPFAFLDLFPEFVKTRSSEKKRDYVTAPDDYKRRYYA